MRQVWLGIMLTALWPMESLSLLAPVAQAHASLTPTIALATGDCIAYFQASQTPQAKPSSSEQPAAKLPPEQLDSLVAPVALYPDPLLAQVLAASTYPLEIIQLQQ